MAPVTNMEHAQSWTVTVVPGDGDEPWPLVTGPDGMSLEPDLILIWFQTGRDPVVKGSGRRVRRAGTVGSLRVNAPWAVLDDLPDWARKMTDDALAEHGMLAHVPHEIVPLPGSVQANRDHANHHPLTALCSQCQEPVVREAALSGWEHRS